VRYTFPPGFELGRARELGALVGAAYQQLHQGPAWQPPAGYTTLQPSLSSTEVWKAHVVTNLLGHVGVALPKVPFGFVAAKGNDVYVVIRGTQTPLEWLDDFTAQPVDFRPGGQDWGHTTKGFSMVHADLGPQILQLLATPGVVRPGTSIYVTGHSLGAALAHLAAAEIWVRYGPALAPVSYTFCGPRAGGPAFAKAFETAGLTTWRIVNSEDLVPTVPPAAVLMTEPNMGMHGMSPLTQAISQFVQLGLTGYQHIGYPIVATFHQDTVAGNHNLDALEAELVRP